jgi:hypothetical protein
MSLLEGSLKSTTTSSMRKEVSDLNKRITDLESALARKQSMTMAYGAYWTKEGGPFCQLCWEYD